MPDFDWRTRQSQSIRTLALKLGGKKCRKKLHSIVISASTATLSGMIYLSIAIQSGKITQLSEERAGAVAPAFMGVADAGKQVLDIYQYITCCCYPTNGLLHCVPVQEGYRLSTAANGVRRKAVSAGAAGDSLLHRPADGVCIVGAAGNVLEDTAAGRRAALGAPQEGYQLCPGAVCIGREGIAAGAAGNITSEKQSRKKMQKVVK